MAYGKISDEVKKMIHVKINEFTDTVERAYCCRRGIIEDLDDKFKKSFNQEILVIKQEILVIAKEKLATCYPEKKITIVDWNFNCALSTSETYSLLSSIIYTIYDFKRDLETKIIGQLELIPNDKREEKLEELLMAGMEEFNAKYSIKKLEEILNTEKES